MSVIAVNGVIEGGAVRLAAPVPVPDRTPVVVFVENVHSPVTAKPAIRVHRPRLLYPEDALLLTQTDRRPAPVE